MEPAAPRPARHQRHRDNTPAENPQVYWRRVLFYSLMDHLIIEIKDQMVIPKAHFVAQSLIPMQLPHLLGKEVELFEAFEEDLTSLADLQGEIRRWTHRCVTSLNVHN